MAAPDRILGKGARLYYSTDGGSTYTELTEISDLGAPDEGETEQIEATPLNPSSNAKEFLNGLTDTGKFSFKQFMDKKFTRFKTLRLLKGTLLGWRIVGPMVTGLTTAPKIEFDGNLEKVNASGFVRNQPTTIDCDVQVTGAVTLAEGV